jgi:hypothetical protein
MVDRKHGKLTLCVPCAEADPLVNDQIREAA